MEKKECLIENGTYNKNHERVKDARFAEGGFFDPMDIAQVKYEMLKEVEQNGASVTDAAEDFGFSRTAFYSIKDAFNKHGIKGLIPEKPGPRKPHKLTPEYQELIEGWISQSPGISSSELAKRVNESGADNVSKRTIERYRTKKKLG